MATTKWAGKLFGFRINGIKIDCQGDATLNITTNVSEEDVCKPSGDDPEDTAAAWLSRTVDSRDWSLDVTAFVIKETFAPANDAAAIDKLIIDGDYEVDDIEFLTPAGQQFADWGILYSGAGILTGFTLNAPITGVATQDFSIVGNGALTRTPIPKST